MRISAAFILILVMLTSTAYAQGAPPAAPVPPAPGMPAMPNMARGLKTITVGPVDSKGMPRKVNGKVSVLGIVPRNIASLSTVEIFVDGNIIGRADKAPYRVEFDTATVSDGEHIIKAVGKDTEGKEVWSSTTKTLVNNSGKPDGAPALPGAENKPTPAPNPIPDPAPNVEPNQIPQEAPPAAEQPAEPMAETPALPPPEAENPTPPEVKESEEPVLPAVPMQVNQEEPNVTQYELSKTFTSSKYKFSIQYPNTWAVEDATAKMRPKLSGGFWFVMSAKPVNKADMVVNVRRMKLAPTTDGDTFAKYNNYVMKWERKTVLDAPAFATTGGSAESKRVVHRTIVVKNGSAWMLNCIDTSGKPASDSALLFESIINTLTIQ